MSEPPPRPRPSRRSPRFSRFILTGALVGAAIALVLALSLPDPPGYGARTIAGYLMAIGTLLGGVVGGGVAVLANRDR